MLRSTHRLDNTKILGYPNQWNYPGHQIPFPRGQNSKWQLPTIPFSYPAVHESSVARFNDRRTFFFQDVDRFVACPYLGNRATAVFRSFFKWTVNSWFYYGPESMGRIERKCHGVSFHISMVYDIVAASMSRTILSVTSIVAAMKIRILRESSSKSIVCTFFSSPASRRLNFRRSSESDHRK